MARISEQTIEHIRSSLDIIDVIGKYVQLKKRGHNFFGLCPFHDEKTPSFAVNPSKQIYKCFGCGSGGGTINFVMSIEKIDFKDAIYFLGEEYGINIDISSTKKYNNVHSQILDIQNIALELYNNNLYSENGKKILDYLQKRGLDNKTISTFKLGYSDDHWSILLNKIRKMNFTSDALIQSGLFINGEKGYYDRFRNRLMFPIFNRNDKAVAFAGRTLDKNNSVKYINSSETPIYNKSSILYGLSKSKSFLIEKNEAIIVEGYLDYLQLYQAGIKNVVAVSGTALTDKHVFELNRYVKNVKIAYDGDQAGKNSAIKAGYIAMKNGLTAQIVEIPNGLDPDDWVKKDGPKPFLGAVNKGSNLFEFHINNSSEDINSSKDLSSIINEIVFEISQIPNPIFRELCIQELSRIVKINERVLHESLQSYINKKQSRKSKIPVETIAKDTSNSILEDELLQSCFSDNEKIRDLIFNNMNERWLKSDINSSIYNQVYIHLKSEFALDANIIMDGLKEKHYRDKLAFLIFELDKKIFSVNMVIDILIRLESDYMRRSIAILRNQIKTANKVDTNKNILEIDKIQKKIINIKKKFINHNNEI